MHNLGTRTENSTEFFFVLHCNYNWIGKFRFLESAKATAVTKKSKSNLIRTEHPRGRSNSKRHQRRTQVKFSIHEWKTKQYINPITDWRNRKGNLTVQRYNFANASQTTIIQDGNILNTRKYFSNTHILRRSEETIYIGIECSTQKSMSYYRNQTTAHDQEKQMDGQSISLDFH